MFRFLASYAFFRKQDLSKVADAAGGRCEMFADSGAYSAFTQGTEVRLADYSAWLTDWRDLITVASTLDVIGDPAATARNTALLREQGHNVLPVFHTGSPWPVLEKMCSENAYVALGGMVPYSGQPREVRRWLIKCFLVGREHGTVFHGFGQTNVKILSDLPFYSVDSSSWSFSAQWGWIPLWDPRVCRFRTLYTGTPGDARKYAALLRSHGLDPVKVAAPGFGHQKSRGEAQYRSENRSLRAAPARAYYRFGEWLTERHRVAPPFGFISPGTALFLADATVGNLTVAAQTITEDSLEGSAA